MNTQDLPPLPDTPPGRYRHYKGGEYELVGAARHSETLEPLVVYSPLYNASGLWVRPHAMFFEQVLIDGRLQRRFAPVGEVPSGPEPAPAPAPTGAAVGLRIAAIALEHARGFHHCLDTVAREKRYLAQFEAPPFEKLLGFVQDSVASDAAQFVALDGEQVVGWVDIFPSWAHAVQHCGSLGMGLLPTHRGQGLGRRLLLACLAKAQAQGITRVTLEARADNAVAIHLYEAVGFRHEALKRQAMRYDGEYFDAVQMSLILPESVA